jgi:hypothetical protein
MVNIFENWGVSPSDKHFTPHLTLMKLSKAKNLHKKGILKFYDLLLNNKKIFIIILRYKKNS